jgi:antitoxin VapB
VVRLAAEVARLAGENKTEAVRRALDERKARLKLRVVKRDRVTELRRYLEKEVWPVVPRRVLGRRLTRREDDAILGFGPKGV